ncbi:CoA-transferase family III [Ascoidea rubescens DSM 1968]|uniref:CoA-transferase family III n=1 Tax=Ascoidea rubescens DSM 1968 TaxID=1344418 RepID=A0A1D2VK37_9ASCO|nr:CoA-transferase family III [Ascoidea rubescens DSM 1968]ODV61974.1 CoA-transferase family III [Ascoidea rubescens DSM 1968]
MTQSSSPYNQTNETIRIFKALVEDPLLDIPREIKDNVDKIQFTNDQTSEIILPCRLKECETAAALKGLEALAAIAISNLRFNNDSSDSGSIDLQHALMFLFLTYLSSVDGLGKLDKDVIKYLKPTDLNQAQSITYRRMSANLYETKDKGRYYHIHGSLEASTQLKLIGLPPYNPKLTDYNEIVNVLQGAVHNFSVDELEEQTLKYRQAGVEAMKSEDFLQTPHGKTISSKPFWEIEALETDTPPVEFASLSGDSAQKPQILKGLKVLELCRIIAGPTIGRILAEYGAEVIKVTSPTLPDVPFFQIDCNFGKHTCELNLKNKEDRVKFEELLKDADIVLDGYRTNAIEKLGYGPSKMTEFARQRNKGYIYGSENCFGFSGEWSDRAGWQQIADCASGIAWIQGQSLGLNEPMVPPFPMSDYGTGCMVAIAILLAVYKRAKFGGSYWCKSSLIQYDLLLMKQGLYPDDIWKNVLSKSSKDVLKLRYYDSVDKISSTCLRSMKRFKPDLFNGEGDQSEYFTKSYSEGFKGTVKVLKPVVQMKNTRNGFNTSTRPNGYDKPEWFMN